MNRVWMITGCSSGFGRMLAERALTLGDSVVATARSVQSLYDLGRNDERRILRLPLDVCRPEQITHAVNETIGKFGRIDILVNNAGYGYFATQEEGSLDEIRAMYETNVFGLIAATKAVLPHMRTQRHGTIINLSSIGGRIATPRGGYYQSTKWAVEALSEALHIETMSFGIRVIVIEPGAYETDFASRSARQSEAERLPGSPYAELRARWVANAAAAIFPRRQDPAEVIDTIVGAVERTAPFMRIPIGTDATTIIARREEMGSSRFVEWIRNIYDSERPE
ncbi:MAG: SDR family oxidoreductase [Bacteroidetes bacterium]|nr:SDR family oxidoreductase [Bacteroidota bacterium]